MTERLFVYGTLMDPVIQEEVFGREIPGIPDLLYGYRLGTVTFGNETFPAVRRILPVISDESGLTVTPFSKERVKGTDEDQSAGVPGIVLEVSDEDILKADFYEGEYYSRTEVTLKSGKLAYIYEIED